MQIVILESQALASLQLLKNLPVSRAWRGFGSAIFLEFGPLDSEGAGAYTLTATKDWLLRSGAASANENSEYQEIDALLHSLEQMTVQEVSIADDALHVELDRAQLRIGLQGFSNGEWSLSPIEGAFLTTAMGSFVLEKEGELLRPQL